MPARRNQDKTKATATPLAAIAPTMPLRPDAEDAPREDDVPYEASVAEVIADDPAFVSTDAAEEVETLPRDAIPAPSRRGARKIVPKRSGAGVPRTIAELQRQEAGEPLMDDTDGLTTEANIDAPPSELEDAIQQAVEEPPVLLVPLRVVAITTAALWLLAGLIPQIVLVVGERTGLSGVTSLYTYDIALVVGGAIALLILLRAVRGAFGPDFHDLNWRTLLEVWSRRTPSPVGGLPRRDGWTLAALAALGGFIFLAGLLLFNALQRAPLSLPYLPYLIATIFSRAVLGATFLGLLQPALTTVFTRARAALTTGIAYGIAIAALNGFVVAFSRPGADAQGQVPTITSTQLIAAIALSATISFFVGVGIAWFRLRARSVWAAVAFQLTLLLLQFPV